ncbi:unnamed protein product [Penicillium glandicola]
MADEEERSDACYVGMRVNYCGAVWTIGSMVAGGALNAAFLFVIINTFGQTMTVSGAHLSPV